MSENALGKATGSSDADDKEFSCPSCGDTFDSKNGRNVHHYQKHGESIAFSQYECYTCGKQFERRKCEVKDVEKPVCSLDCRSKVLSEAHSGENNHKYKESMVECDECCETIEVQPIKLETQDNHFCNLSCYAKWLSKNNCGKDHHQYKEDKKNSRLYQTKKWKLVRENARKRDGYKCQGCGSESDLIVHHIHPVNDGGDMYDLDNLVTLCRSCHMLYEGLYLKPTLID